MGREHEEQVRTLKQTKREREGHVTTLRKKRTKQGGMAMGNKEAGREEHMANSNKDKAICSHTTQTRKHLTGTGQTWLSGEIPDSHIVNNNVFNIFDLSLYSYQYGVRIYYLNKYDKRVRSKVILK